MKKLSVFKLLAIVLVLCGLLVSGNAGAEVYNLTAVKGCISLPDGTITEVLPCPVGTTAMWGLKNNVTGRWIFEQGQQLTVTNGLLTVNLTNNLGIPTSLWLPGQAMTNNAGPVWFTSTDSHTLPVNPYTAGTLVGSRGANLTARVRSFAHEVAPTATGTYTWGAVKPGTFILQSGTQPALQVPMGLYGAVTVTGGGYPGTAFDVETLLLFSEIDPAINNAVTDATAGTFGTFHYKPKYFLVNGKPFTPGVSSLVAGTVGQTTLVRLANAGLFNHTAMMLGEFMTVRAEDGNIYPATKQNDLNTVLLTAGKTIDATFAPAAEGYYPVFDRRLYVANDTAPSGGLMNYLRVPSGVDATLNMTTTVAGPGTPGGKVIAASLPGGIDCASVSPVAGGCTEVINANTTIALQAIPNAGSSYRWTTVGAGLCNKAKGACEVTVAAPATTINAEFRPLRNLGVFLNGQWYLDWDGDGVWQGTPIDNFVASFGGAPGAVGVVGDWNGNGLAKIGVFLGGNWYLDWNGNGVWDGDPTDKFYAGFGSAAGAIPVVGDWTGTGTTKIGVFLGGSWYLDWNGNGVWDGPVTDKLYTGFGSAAGAVPVVGDWTGTGTTKIGAFLGGNWYLDWNGDGVWEGAPNDKVYAFGAAPGAMPVVSDWNDDGVSKIGVFLGGTWYLDWNGDGVWQGAPTDRLYTNYGVAAGAQPVAGHW